MDFLAVAAAAGAGYVAKYLHKISKEGDRESISISTNAAQGRQEQGKTRPLTDTARDYGGSYSDLRSLGGNLGREVDIGAESISGERVGDLGRHRDCNLPSLTSLPPGLDEKETFRFGSANSGGEELIGFGSANSGGEELIGFGSANSGGEELIGERFEFAHRFRKGGSVRSRRPHSNFTKPLNSLESRLASQLYKQHCTMENYVLAPLPPPSTRLRPLLITDGERIISRASSEVQADTRLEMNRIEDGILSGAPTLPKRSMGMRRRSVDFQRRVKQNHGGQRVRKIGSSRALLDIEPRNPNGMVLFLAGVTLGILSTAVANKREVDRLTELLKQSENLVQDLQEEIEMKDSVTVKELASEKIGDRESDGNIASPKDPTTRTEDLGDCEKDASKQDDQTAQQSEKMSEIEAELEAELERLGLNMKGSTLERVADSVELDADYEADVARGEFRLDTVTKRVNEDYRTSTAPTDHANRPVSPRELSLRLHQVIGARLEARITELETALKDSQRRVRSLELSTIKTKANSQKGSASPQSSSSLDERNSFDQPLVINLAGDALDAFNEAYEEIFRMVKTEDETPPDTTYNSNPEESKTMPLQTPSMTNPSRLQNTTVEERSPVASIEKVHLQEQLSKNIGSDDESEDGDDDDILGKLLIQQIVEKTRQGSPLVLNAQRILFSKDQ